MYENQMIYKYVFFHSVSDLQLMDSGTNGLGKMGQDYVEDFMC